ncbi:hypothetical protein MMC17_008201 [Xylographa soralifera]|nr:hypothetical protein [Xylographa soralifera]
MVNQVLSGTDEAESPSNTHPIRLLIIGAGSRGNAYAEAVTSSTTAVIAGVAEPITFKREALGKKYIWYNGHRQDDQEFEGWKAFLEHEITRRKRVEAGESETVLPGFDGLFVCTPDDTHVEIITALAPLGMHIMSEKPLATTLTDCLRIYRSLKPPSPDQLRAVFSIGHVLRYSPHNMLLRKLLLEDGIIGDVISIEHTEPVGWWHFSHSYVRGNWRKESTTAPSLLTKSCHDIDFVLWLLCSTSASAKDLPHLPTWVSSTGCLSFFKKSRKPPLAKEATNCLSCPIENTCIYSAKKIYDEHNLAKGVVDWPVNVVEAEIEDCLATQGMPSAETKLLKRLAEDYDDNTSQEEIDSRPWFGRCVWESDNDVCDDQLVTMTWDEESSDRNGSSCIRGRGSKTASIHMIAFTEKQCERRGRIYGTQGEIEYDGKMIRVYDFATREAKTFYPSQPGGGHGGGDRGLAQQFVTAMSTVRDGLMSVAEAQKVHIGCTLEDAIRSHAMVFAAEEARRNRRVVDWKEWWALNVEAMMG